MQLLVDGWVTLKEGLPREEMKEGDASPLCFFLLQPFTLTASTRGNRHQELSMDPSWETSISLLQMGSLLHCMQRCEVDLCPETTSVVLGGTSQLLITPFSVVTHQKLLCMLGTLHPWGCSKAWGSPVLLLGHCWESGSEGDKSGCAYVFMQPCSYTSPMYQSQVNRIKMRT